MILESDAHREAHHETDRSTLVIAVVLIASTSLGCGVIGPRAIRSVRGDYNGAIQLTNNEQLLLNLVRLRYDDSPLFLEVTNVNMEVEAIGGAAAEAGVPEHGFDTFTFRTNGSLRDDPIIQMSVLGGKDFSQQLLSPLPLDAIVSLYDSGWPIRRILMLGVQQLNGVKNAPTAAGPMPHSPPEFAAFSDVAWALQGLQSLGALTIGRAAKEGPFLLRIDEPHRASKPARDFEIALGLKTGEATYELVMGSGKGSPKQIELLPRSLMGTLFYLSKGVEPAAADAAANHPRVGLTFDGTTIFDWGALLDGIFAAHSAKWRPHGAFVAVPYRGNWFYVEDTDVDSRVTLTLIGQLFSLQSGPIPAAAPLVLTK